MTIAYQSIFFSSGLFLTALAFAMIAPGLLDYFSNDINWQAFAISSSITGFSGLLLTFAAKPTSNNKISLRDTFLLTTFNWLTLAFFAALPFIFSNSTNTYTDSFFEAISGLTTTGATVIRGLNYTSSGILLWRAILQWLGGIGIVVMALTIMPTLRIGGMQLFRNEFSDRSEKILPKVSQIASAIFGTYVFFTILCGLALWTAGMSWLEAICHAMATLSTGGFSTYESSIAHFDSLTIEIILMFFMIIGGTTLILFVRCFQGDMTSLFKDQQVKAFLFIMLIAILSSTLWLWSQDYFLLTALRHAAFQAVSVMSTTGFVSTDYTLWGSFRRPHGIFLPLYNNRQIPEGIFLSVFTFFGLFFISLGLLSLALALYGFDIFNCLSIALACLNNVGAGFGNLVSYTGDYASLPTGAKWLLMMGMILGRLEYITVLIVLSPKFWRG